MKGGNKVSRVSREPEGESAWIAFPSHFPIACWSLIISNNLILCPKFSKAILTRPSQSLRLSDLVFSWSFHDLSEYLVLISYTMTRQTVWIFLLAVVCKYTAKRWLEKPSLREQWQSLSDQSVHLIIKGKYCTSICFIFPPPTHPHTHPHTHTQPGVPTCTQVYYTSMDSIDFTYKTMFHFISFIYLFKRTVHINQHVCNCASVSQQANLQL